MITIQDTKSLDGNGYSFSFVIPVSIDHNEAEKDNFARTDFTAPDVGGDFCSQKTFDTYKIIAVDERDGWTMEGVNISYECVTKRCYLGTTSFDGIEYGLTTSIPSACTGGFIKASGDDIMTSVKPVFLDELEDMQIIRLPVRKMVTLEYEVVKHGLNNSFFGREIPDDENILMSIKSNSINYTDFKIYPGYEEKNTIRLFEDDHSYYVDIMLLDKNDTLIGGFKYNWSVNYDELMDAKKVIFHVLEKIPHPKDYEEQAELLVTLQNYTYPTSLMPTLKGE